MPLFHIYAPVSGVIYIGPIQADIREDALAAAVKLPSYRRPALCCNCGHKIPDISTPGEPFVGEDGAETPSISKGQSE